MRKNAYDAVIIGSGPNGLAAAITLAQAGLSVVVLEAKETIGGGMRSAELTLPGFTHDICSAIHPLGIASPFFQSLRLEQHGLEWIQPPSPSAHPFEDGTAVLLEKSLEETAYRLGHDSDAYIKIMHPLIDRWPVLVEDILGTMRWPKHPIALARLGWIGLRSAASFAKARFQTPQAQALLAGLSAHAVLPLEKPLTAGFGLILGLLAHTVGWPIAKGGSQSIANAMASLFRSYGGEIAVNTEVKNLDELPKARAILCDITPRQLLQIAGDRLPSSFQRTLRRYRYGPGVFKVDWALNSPIPWKARECFQAATVHLGGTLEEIAFSERTVWQNQHPERPYVLLAQQSLFDASRAPEGKHTAWAYCHVPSGSTFDMTERIESQIERVAPGFKDCIIARNVKTAAAMQKYNSNYIGGDIIGGVQDVIQQFARPSWRWVPYSTPIKDLYLCSSSTPPGGGVHGMCGYHAAKAALGQIPNSIF